MAKVRRPWDFLKIDGLHQFQEMVGRRRAALCDGAGLYFHSPQLLLPLFCIIFKTLVAGFSIGRILVSVALSVRSEFSADSFYCAAPETTATFSQTCAVRFVPTVTGSLEELYAAIQPDPLFTDRSYTLRLLADVGNYPGAALWETSALTWPVADNEVFHLDNLGGPTLIAGQSYWLQADKPIVSDAGHFWNANNQGYMGSIALAHSGNPWSIHDNQELYGLRVLVAVPEPATMGLLALGLAAMAARRKRA